MPFSDNGSGVERLETPESRAMYEFSTVQSSTLRSSAAVERRSGFFTRQRVTNSVNAVDQRFGFRNDGGGFVGIMKMARIGWISPYGGFPSAGKQFTVNIQKLNY